MGTRPRVVLYMHSPDSKTCMGSLSWVGINICVTIAGKETHTHTHIYPSLPSGNVRDQASVRVLPVRCVQNTAYCNLKPCHAVNRRTSAQGRDGKARFILFFGGKIFKMRRNAVCCKGSEAAISYLSTETKWNRIQPTALTDYPPDRLRSSILPHRWWAAGAGSDVHEHEP